MRLVWPATAVGLLLAGATMLLATVLLAAVLLATALLATALLATGVLAQPAMHRNDYPTPARADYVFACMAANGQTRDMLIRCSCSIDVIASILPYDAYVRGETVLSMRRVSGERMAIFRTAESANTAVADLRRAQAEGEIRCF